MCFILTFVCISLNIYILKYINKNSFARIMNKMKVLVMCFIFHFFFCFVLEKLKILENVKKKEKRKDKVFVSD
jgi:hypothetical protein